MWFPWLLAYKNLATHKSFTFAIWLVGVGGPNVFVSTVPTNHALVWVFFTLFHSVMRFLLATYMNEYAYINTV